MEKRKTCAGCPHLAKSEIPMSGIVYYCGRTDHVIPHRSERQDNEWEVTFWRVPENCPLPDAEVEKRAKIAPKRDWVVRREPVGDL